MIDSKQDFSCEDVFFFVGFAHQGRQESRVWVSPGNFSNCLERNDID